MSSASISELGEINQRVGSGSRVSCVTSSCAEVKSKEFTWQGYKTTGALFGDSGNFSAAKHYKTNQLALRL